MRFTRSRVVFATVHVLGSEIDPAAWSGLPRGDRADRLLPQFAARTAPAFPCIDAAFREAEAERAAGVLLMMQAEPPATRVRDLASAECRPPPT